MTPRGLPYPGWRLYHATSACSAIVNDGFMTRAERAALTGRTEHFAGGGTAYAVSMTLDPRVAESIIVGLKVISRLVKGTMNLGELLIAGAEQAPSGTEDVIKTWQLTPERVLRYDEGLYPFHTRMLVEGMTLGEARAQRDVLIDSAFENSPERGYGDEVERVPEGAVDVVAFFAAYSSDLAELPPDRRAIAVSGWAPKLQVAKVSHYARDTEAYENNARFVEMYKRMLAMSTFDAQEVYDPLFFLTSLDAMRAIDEDQLCVIETDCKADWLCISPLDAKRLGILPEGVYLGADFARSCEQRLEWIARGGREVPRSERTRDAYRVSGGERDWDQPEPSDTVTYLGRAMAEVRVYDSSLLVNPRMFKNLDDVEYEIDPDYEEPGHNIIAYPWFRARGN